MDFQKVNPNCIIHYTTHYLKTYLTDIYDCIINQFNSNITNDVLIVKEKIEYQDVFVSVCIKFNFYKEDPHKSLLCLQIMNVSIIINNSVEKTLFLYKLVFLYK